MKINQFAVVLTLLIPCAAWAADMGAIADTYVDSTSPAVNFGNGNGVRVSATQTGLLQFDLSGISSSSTISRATLVTFVSSVTTSGSIAVAPLTGPWTENGVTFNTAPAASGPGQRVPGRRAETPRTGSAETPRRRREQIGPG